MPTGAESLATSADCVFQAMSCGSRAYSMQFHLEVEEETIDNWAALPAYSKALCSALGSTGVPTLKSAWEEQMNSFAENAERFYINWLHATATT